MSDVLSSFDERQDIGSWVASAIASATMSAVIVLYAGEVWKYLSLSWLSVSLTIVLYVVYLLFQNWKARHPKQNILGFLFPMICVLFLLAITIWTVVTVSGDHPVREF